MNIDRPKIVLSTIALGLLFAANPVKAADLSACSNSSSATSDGYCLCGDLILTNVKSDNDKVTVLWKNSSGDVGGWHLLASYSHPSVNQKLAVALSAKSTGYLVSMSFPLDTDCMHGSNTQSISIEIENK
jgi:hypothetical protein